MLKIIRLLAKLLPIIKLIKKFSSNSNEKTMLLNLLLNAVKTAASAELSILLEKFKEHNSDEDYQKLLASLKNSFELLQKVAAQTKTKVDDTVVGIVLNSLPND